MRLSGVNIKRYLTVLTLLLVALSTHTGATELEKEEAGAGIGFNINGEESWQILLAASLLHERGTKNIYPYLEADLEIINTTEDATLVAGITQFLRFTNRVDETFLELGAGVNLKDRDHIGTKKLAGRVVFSLNIGVGKGIETGYGKMEVSLRFRHLSNGGLYSPNESFNSLYLMVSRRF